jgi:hypothetical protein
MHKRKAGRENKLEVTNIRNIIIIKVRGKKEWD